MRPQALLVPFLFAAALTAQPPADYLLVAGYNSNGPGIFYLEPATGVVTPLRMAKPGSTLIKMAAAVALDPADPQSIYYNPGISVSVAPTITVAAVQGASFSKTSTLSMRGIAGLPMRMRFAGPDVLLSVSNGTAPGLYRGVLQSQSATLLVGSSNAFGIATLGSKAYVSSYQSGMPSSVSEVDLTTLQTRVVGTGYAAFRGLTVFANVLLAGTDAGDLMLIDPATGNGSPFLSPGKGAILAVTAPGGSIFFATAQDEIWSIGNLATPLHKSTFALKDLDVGIHQQAAFLQFGDGCPGSNQLVPFVGANGLPSIGNGAFALTVRDARALAAGVWVLGVSRTRLGAFVLPLDLGVIQMPGCFLYTDLLATTGFVVTASGSAMSSLPIPNLPSLFNGHVSGQAFVVDAGGPPLGLVASDGLEMIVR